MSIRSGDRNDSVGARFSMALVVALAALALGASSAAAVALHGLTSKGCIADTGDAAGCGAEGQGLYFADDVATSPDGKSVYVVSAGDSAIARFDRAAGGALTPAGCIEDVGASAGCGAETAGLGGIAADAPLQVEVSPDGASVYAVSSAEAAIVRFDRSPSGALTPAGCIQDVGASAGCGTEAEGLDFAWGGTVSPDGDSVYVAGPGDDAIARFDRSPGGALTPAGCIKDVGGSAACGTVAQGLNGAGRVAVSPDGTSVYATADTDDSLVSFDRAAGGALTPAGCIEELDGDVTGCGEEAEGLGRPLDIAVSPDGASVYTVGPFQHDIVSFDRSASGALTPAGCIMDAGASVGCGAEAEGLRRATGVAVSPNGASVYVSSVTDDALVRFDRSASGALTPAGCIEDAGGTDTGCSEEAEGLNAATGVAASSDDASVYVASNVDHALVRFDRELAPVCETSSSSGEPGEVQTVALDCSDPNGDPVEIEVTKGPANGALGAIDQLNAEVTYTPDGGFTGADSFDVRSSSDGKRSNTATVVIGVLSATGPQGPPGSSGEDGSDRDLLAAAIAADVTKTKSKNAKVRIVTTLAGTATLEAAPKGKSKRKGRAAKKAKTRTVSADLAGSGRHTLKLKKLKRGATYKLGLEVKSSDGQQASDTAKLKVVKKR